MATYSRKRPFSTTLPSQTPTPSRPLHASKKRKPTPLPHPRLTQTTIDLGGPQHLRCRDCGMHYVPHHADDAALHRRYHAARVGGISLPANLASRRDTSVAYTAVRARRPPRPAQDICALDDEDAVVRVARGSSGAARAAAERVLSVAEEELGAVATGAEALWGRVAWRAKNVAASAGEKRGQLPTPPGSSSPMPIPVREACGVADRHVVFMYVQGGKAVGLLLAERIVSARRVVGEGAPVVLADGVVCARLGVSRIWVTRTHRRLGVAGALLDAVLGGWGGEEEGDVLGKEDVALSQPTESGRALAERWFGGRSGWLVYTDKDCAAEDEGDS